MSFSDVKRDAKGFIQSWDLKDGYWTPMVKGNEKTYRVHARDYSKDEPTHVRKIETTRQLLDCLRAGQWAWPGGYEVFFITSDGGVLSFESVVDNLRQVLWSIRNKCSDGWRVVALECASDCDGPVICDDTGKIIVEGE